MWTVGVEQQVYLIHSSCSSWSFFLAAALRYLWDGSLATSISILPARNLNEIKNQTGSIKRSLGRTIWQAEFHWMKILKNFSRKFLQSLKQTMSHKHFWQALSGGQIIWKGCLLLPPPSWLDAARGLPTLVRNHLNRMATIKETGMVSRKHHSLLQGSSNLSGGTFFFFVCCLRHSRSGTASTTS